METVEIIVYLAIAVIIGALIIAFIAGWDAHGTYEGMRDLFRGQDADEYEEITSDELALTVIEVWEACGLGSVEYEKIVYVKDEATLNKALIFTKVKQYNLCKTLQSANNDCGTGEDMWFPPQDSPAVLTIRCVPTGAKKLHIR